VVLLAGAYLVGVLVVGRIDLDCGVREARFVVIVVGRLLASCVDWTLLWVFGVFVARKLELWFCFVVLVGLQKQKLL
jgi:hypothetical protein